jgi:uncharacterized membrane protein YedE/YeeE
MVHQQLPWYIGGPMLGLCVVAIRGLLNQRLGITGGFSEIIDRVGHRNLTLGWRSWFAIGVVLGGLGFGLAAGGPDFHGYGWMTDTFSGAGQIFIGVLLFVSGILIAFGAKTAQGCTSGNGLSGSSLASPSSLVATGVFFGTAIAVSFLIKALI